MPTNVPNVSRSGDQPLLVEVLFQGPLGTKPVPLHADFFEGLTIELGHASAWKGHLNLFDHSGDFILSLIAASGQDRRILLRWGWDDGRSIEVYPQYVARYTTFEPEFTAQGTRIGFDLVTDVSYGQALDKKTRSFKAGTLLSDIVAQIAQERGWSTKDTKGHDTIEPVHAEAGALTEDLVQRGESDFYFIRAHVLPRAINQNKQGPYRFFIDDRNAVHFHTDFFGALTYAEHYIFSQQHMGDVIEFSPSDLKFFANLLGGGPATFWSIDSLKGERVQLASTDAAGLPGAKLKVETSAAYLTEVLPHDLFGIRDTIVSKYLPILARTGTDFERKVRARFARLRDFAYSATLSVRGTHAVLPTRNVRVDYLTTDEQKPHPLSGVFFVSGIQHDVGSGGWQTRMELHRQGIQQTDGALAVEGVDRETATKGAEFQMGSGESGQRMGQQMRLSRTSRDA